jgi:hypothetical protein
MFLTNEKHKHLGRKINCFIFLDKRKKDEDSGCNITAAKNDT